MTPQEIETKRDLIAHEIAKTVCEKTGSYWDAFYILEKVKTEIERTMKSKKAEAAPYPIDRYGKK